MYPVNLLTRSLLCELGFSRCFRILKKACMLILLSHVGNTKAGFSPGLLILLGGLSVRVRLLGASTLYPIVFYVISKWYKFIAIKHLFSTMSCSTSIEFLGHSSSETGAMTPCSMSGVSSIPSLSSIYLYFLGPSFTAYSLEETFRKHAVDGRMGVIIDQNSVNQPFSCKGEWIPLSLPSCANDAPTINYFISNTVTMEGQVYPAVGLI